MNEKFLTLTDTLTVGAAGAILRNRGQINVIGGRLKLVGTQFIAEGTVVGGTTFASTRVTGTGSLGSAIVIQSSIEPGSPTNRYGSLTSDALQMVGPKSSVVLEIGGTAGGAYDKLKLLGQTTWGGTLDLRQTAPFLGGICGQVVRILEYDVAATVTGQFATILGDNPAPGRAWRLSPANQADALIGYDPRVPISVSYPSITLGEGLPPLTYSVCARSAPTALVTVAVSVDVGEAVLNPPATSFSPTDWTTPAKVIVSMIDDAIVEPTKVDSIRHTVTSSDPAYNNARVPVIAVTALDNDGNADLGLSIVVPPPKA